ncbi:MAG: M50 family metallopeptidase [Chthoniobacterales bacterium]
MSWSIPIFRVSGIQVRIHVTFLLLLIWLGAEYYARSGSAAAAAHVFFILLLFGCVLLHEFGHAIAAKSFGIRTPDITLLPIGGVARMERMPEKPMQELIVALAGPAVNVVIALALFLVSGLERNPIAAVESPSLMQQLLAVNIMLVLFNLVPAFPMDGGRVLRALLATRLNYARATQIAASVGRACAFIFGLVGLMNGNFIWVFIALFIYIGASQEAAVAQMRDFSRGMPVSSAMVREFRTLSTDSTLLEAVDALLATSQHDFPVVEPSGAIAGVLLRKDLIGALRKDDPSIRVGDIIRRGVPTVTTGTPFDEAFRIMQESNCPAVPVVDRMQRLVGLLTPENVSELMMIHSAMPRRRRMEFAPA